jgi:hypothetical protein
MNFKNIFFVFAMASLAFLISCSDDDADHSEDSKFEYHAHIHSPNADNKHVGDTLNIIVEFESHTGEPVHHINVTIYNKADKTVIYNMPTEAHVHGTSGSYEFNNIFILSNENGVTAHSDWVLEAKVWGETDGEEEETETVGFHVHP